ncbi:MAG: P-loop NTPase, partial [Anaerolineales bacterium]|nr:P-loop NTPase [Anaerolineales bacterium]
MNKMKSLPGSRIGVLGKGGAGKSTLVAILAQALHRRGYDVCVIDADSTNFGLPQSLGMDSPPKTLLDLYGGMVFSGGVVTCPVDDPTPLADPEITMDELSRQYYAQNDAGIILMTAGKIGNHGPGAGCDGPIAKIARDLIVHNGNGELFTLIDFKAGFEDSARGVLTNLDWAIVVIDPTIASVEIASDMRAMIDQIKADVLPATAHLESPELVAVANKLYTDAKIKDVFFVMNKIPDKETEKYLREKLAQKDID